MRQLDFMNDNIVVFTAHEEEMVQDAPNPTSSTPARAPLQPTNAQLSANSNLLEFNPDDMTLKTENGYLSPFELSENIPQFSLPAEVKTEDTPLPSALLVKDEPQGDQIGLSRYGK